MGRSFALFLMVGICTGCGTGPWFIAKKNYLVYTEPILQGAASEVPIPGTYVDERPPRESLWRTSLQFELDGDVLKTDSIIDGRGELHVGHTNGWYKVSADSVFIEYFAPHRKQMYAMVYRHAGHMVNDTSLRMAYTDQPQKIKTFVFVSGLATATVEPPMFARKKWYRERLHPSRHQVTGRHFKPTYLRGMAKTKTIDWPRAPAPESE